MRYRFHFSLLILAALLALCSDHGVPVVPQGGNSGMSGGTQASSEARRVGKACSFRRTP